MGTGRCHFPGYRRHLDPYDKRPIGRLDKGLMDRILAFSQPLPMRTMDCAMLETLLQNREPIELIDVRPAAKFAAMHIPGARSLPLSTLTAPTRNPLPV